MYTTVTNFFITPKSDVFIIKLIFRIAGIFGIFPLQTNFVLKVIHLTGYIILNLIGFICITFELNNVLAQYDTPLTQLILLNIAVSMTIYNHLICIYGLFNGEKLWNQFFKVLNILEEKYYLKRRTGTRFIKLSILAILTTAAQFYETCLVFPKISLTSVLAILASNLVFNDILFTTLTLWEVGNVLFRRYTHLTKIICKIFSNKQQNISSFRITLTDIETNLRLLHRAVTIINSIMGKLLFILFGITFLYTLTSFIFGVWLYGVKRDLDKLMLKLLAAFFQTVTLTVSIIKADKRY